MVHATKTTAAIFLMTCDERVMFVFIFWRRLKFLDSWYVFSCLLSQRLAIISYLSSVDHSTRKKTGTRNVFTSNRPWHTSSCRCLLHKLSVASFTWCLLPVDFAISELASRVLCKIIQMIVWLLYLSTLRLGWINAKEICGFVTDQACSSISGHFLSRR